MKELFETTGLIGFKIIGFLLDSGFVIGTGLSVYAFFCLLFSMIQDKEQEGGKGNGNEQS